MAHQHRVLRAGGIAHLQQVVGVPLKAGVAGGVGGRQLRLADASVVEQDDAVVGGKLRRHRAPDALLAAEAVDEDERRATAVVALDHDIVALQDRCLRWRVGGGIQSTPCRL
jgi:hypothetical protein